MQFLYESLLADLTEDTAIEARMEIYIGLRKLGWPHRRAEAATGIKEWRERECVKRKKRKQTR